MRSELYGDTFGCITFKGSLVGGPPWFENIEMSPLGFGNYLLLLFNLHAFIIDFFACHVLILIMLYAMLIRLEIYLISI